MKTSTKDRVGGKVEEGKGKLKEQVGKVTKNSELEDEGTAEKFGGKVRQMIGKVEKSAGARIRFRP